MAITDNLKTTQDIINTTLNEPITKKLSFTLTRMILNFISPQETAKTTHSVQRAWRHLVGTDKQLDLHDLMITDSDLEQIVNKYKDGNIVSINLEGCDKITDKGLEAIGKLSSLTELNLEGCMNITSVRHLVLLPLKKLNLSFCENIKLKDLGSIAHIPFIMSDLKRRRLAEEASALETFVTEKSKKLGALCTCKFKLDEQSEMSIWPTGTGFEIRVNDLFKLEEQNILAFLLEKSERSESIKKFLSQKKPELLDDVSSELIKWVSQITNIRTRSTDINKFFAKQILMLHAIGKLQEVKRFLLTHEIGHAHDHNGAKSLGDFDPDELDFVKAHQYNEVRADLTAAREDHAHEVGIDYFEWRSIFAHFQDGLGAHPTDVNRAKALRIDSEKLKTTTTTTV